MAPRPTHLALAALAAAAPVAQGFTPQELLVDINTGPPEVNPSATPSDFVTAGGRLFFSATDLTHGRELWTLQPPATQPTLLVDLSPGSTSSSPAKLTALPDGRVLFTATATGQGVELWVTDGTAAGTSLVADINAGPSSSYPTDLTARGNEVFFWANDGVHGYELWRSDATTAGTQLVGEIEVGPGGADAFTQLGDIETDGQTLLVPGHVDGAGWGVWLTDGSIQNTIKLASLDNAVFESVEEVVEMGGKYFFSARNGLGRELWVSDGTVAGTGPIVDLNPAGDANPTGLFATSTQVFFAATEPSFGTELWVTDGTSAGTHLVADLASGGLFFDSSNPEPIGGLGDRFVFSASTPATGREPLITDGTQAGTQFLGDLSPFSGSSVGIFLEDSSAELDGELYFPAYDGVHGTELWATDGTPAGTRLVSDLQPGTNPSSIGSLYAFDGKLWFAADDGTTGTELYGSDGTAAGTDLVLEIFPPATTLGSEPRSLTRLGNIVLFGADDGVHGSEPWVTDGTAAGTHMLLDLYPGEFSSAANSFVALEDRAVFLASTPEYGAELWVTDGTAAGTTLLKDFTPGPVDSFWAGIGNTVFEGRLYFTALTEQGFGLWVTDGTSEGTQLFFGGDTFAFFVGPTLATDDWLYFSAQEVPNGVGTELYRTDGNPANTQLVIDLLPGEQGSLAIADQLIEFGGDVYFTADDGNTGFELWRSDGTAAGTSLVADLAPGSDPSSPREFAVVGDRLLFMARDAAGFFQVFSTDGTAAQTVQLTDEPLGVLIGLNSNGDTAFFRINPSSTGIQLWTSDGTVAGTQLIEVLTPPTFSADFLDFNQIASGPTMLFPNNDGASGYELWSTDGSAEGTGVLFDVAPGAASSLPAEVIRLGGKVLFTATDGVTGKELHVANLTALGEWVAEPYGNPCGVGAPSLSVSGMPQVDQPFALAVGDVAPGLPGLIAVGTAQTFEPLVGDCALRVAQPFALLVPFFTDGAGSFSLPVLLGPAFAGLEFDVQAVTIDVTGLHASSGLEVVVGP
ncbi:ELWxxDGT repeat protein [Engelhardtia mirabilis]|uniref:ELWxxDGT repeat protein n=1 Tax=Engelhardtia mirabilis TaxID=2528011 RepID=A0A518BHN8_9BACT|nr:hypothetical protein Pla133_15270 [Planctomycetes bacterium Pla133]QDV00779.1 hypothetical protein Pla86_15260 [Planctomycetes bacterium Pla86]